MTSQDGSREISSGQVTLARTLELTTLQAKVLLANCLPDFVDLSVPEKIVLAKVSEPYWYKCMRDPKFRQKCVDFVKGHVGDDVPRIYNSYVKLGLKGDRDVCKHLLLHSGVLTNQDKPLVEQTVNMAIEMVEAKREENLKVGLERFGVVVSDNSD